jgi:hypothetical protein
MAFLLFTITEKILTCSFLGGKAFPFVESFRIKETVWTEELAYKLGL